MKIIQTQDGSHSLYHEELDEHYHSIHGAIQEARHVFIKHGLEYFLNSDKEEIHVFEMGFGTGLNAILSFLFAQEYQQKINYCGIEAFPVGEDMIKQLNYNKEITALSKHPAIFGKLHSLSWGESHPISDLFSFEKIHEKIEEYSTEKRYDIVFYDAFGPRAQHDMWDSSLLKKVCDTISPEGVFVTYCAKGQLKRDLKSFGFQVETLSGPPGKREMVRGIKI